MLERITHNWQLKLLALAIAVIMWLIIVGVEKAELTIQIPVEISGVAQGQVVAGEVPAELSVRLYGPRTLIRGVAQRNPVKQINLGGLGPGDHIFRLGIQDLTLPPWVSVVRVDPAEIRVKLEPRSSRDVKVSPVVQGRPARGYEVDEVVFDPPEVKISGEKRALAALDWIWSEPIDVSGHSETFTRTVNLRSPPGSSMMVEPKEVRATILITPKGITQE